MASRKKPSTSPLSEARGVTAPSRPVTEAPDSVLSRTPTLKDELQALDATSYDLVNLEELEMKIGVIARIILEHTLRTGTLAPADKARIALESIRTLEGTKQVIWREDMLNKPKRKTIEALEKEKEKLTKNLLKVAMRKKEVQIHKAEVALKALKSDPPTDEVQ